MATIGPITSLNKDACFDLATAVFVEGSTLHRALGIGLDAYRAYLAAPFFDMVDEGLSVAATEEGEVVGCLIITEFEAKPTDVIPPDFAPLTALTNTLLAQYQNPAEKVALVDMAAVSKAAHRRGLYQQMRHAVESPLWSRGFHRVIGELSSAATQNVVLNKMGHQMCGEVRFDAFTHNGTRPFMAITEPPSLILAEGILSQ